MKTAISQVFTVAAAVGVFVGPAVAVDRWEQQVRAKLLARALGVGVVTDHVATHEPVIGKLDRAEGGRQGKTFEVELDPDKSYVIVAACDDDCADIDLVLRDPKGSVASRDTAADDFPILSVDPDAAATYSLTVVIPACRAVRCSYGIGIFGKPRGKGTTEAVLHDLVCRESYRLVRQCHGAGIGKPRDFCAAATALLIAELPEAAPEIPDSFAATGARLCGQSCLAGSAGIPLPSFRTFRAGLCADAER